MKKTILRYCRNRSVTGPPLQLFFACPWTVIHTWSPRDGVAKGLDFVKEPSADPLQYRKKKLLQDLEKIAMKHSRSGTSERQDLLFHEYSNRKQLFLLIFLNKNQAYFQRLPNPFKSNAQVMNLMMSRKTQV